jgi:hypothetical protein
MSTIKINDIGDHGLDLFDDAESFMNEIQPDDLNGVVGGLYITPTLTGPVIIRTTLTVSTFPTTIRTTVLTTGPWSPVVL